MANRVQYTFPYLTSCRCVQCSVQMKSECVKQEINAIRENIDPLEEMPPPDQTPQIYCSHGTANCPGLDFGEKCACPTCPVWETNGLTSQYYCHDGSADKIG